MKETELLEKFEEKYKFLYEEMVNGVPLYTCLRDDVLLLLQGGHKAQETETKKGKVYLRRIVDGIVKFRKLHNAKTLIFTSAVYRRDHGRNLAVEYLMERYPEAVVFEWPARNDDFDSAYFTDPKRASYCPLDPYVVKYKLLSALHRKGLKQKEVLIRAELRDKFSNAPSPENENEKAAIGFIIASFPSSCVTTEFSQNIFRKMFRRYGNVKYAIDFWGSGRENIFPVLQGEAEKIELQHGIITSFHPGYIYPKFVKEVKTAFFRRKLLVYGKETKNLLTEQSIFDDEQIEVIGNPRIRMYKKLLSRDGDARKIVLFTSQPLQPVKKNGIEVDYYDLMVEYLRVVQESIQKKYPQLSLAIKLHPREDSRIVVKYKSSIPNCEVFGTSSELYDLFGSSVLHITVASTTMYEAAEFDVPTVLIDYGGISAEQRFGFGLLQATKSTELSEFVESLLGDREYNNRYVEYLKTMTSNYM